MQTNDQVSNIDLALLATVHGGLGPVDISAANACAARTAADYAPIGAIAGGIAGGIATGGAGIVPGAELGAKASGLFGGALGWLSSVGSQLFGGNPCPTSPTPPAPAVTSR